jgi:lipopolysaccharide export system protein LptA
MTAAGNVKATLRPRTAGAGKLPGLLQQKEPATVNARTLDYRGATGTATFTGTATLVQGQTAVRGTTLTLDQGTGDLVATGPASSNLVFDTGLSIGRAPEMRYQDSTRRITYGVSAPPAPPGIVIPLASLAHISGPQGELHASRVDVVLGEASDQAERLEAFSNVSVRLDTRVATGDGLTYYSKDERYVMSAVTTTPVKVVEDCRETTGRVVTFFKTGERIIVDGNEQTRTQSRQTVTLLPLPGAAASQPRPRGGGTAPCPSPAR